MPQIDIAEVLRQKAPKLSRRIPRFAVEWLRRTVHERDINHILASYVGELLFRDVVEFYLGQL